MKKHKLTTILVLLATFALGIVFGAMLNRTISQNRIKQYMSMRTREGLIFRLRRVIGPRAVQAEEVRAILEKHAQQISRINEEMKERHATAFKEFYNSLSGVLTPEQMERVLDELPPSPRFNRPFRHPDPRNPGRPMRKFQQDNQPKGKGPHESRDKKGAKEQDRFI